MGGGWRVSVMDGRVEGECDGWGVEGECDGWGSGGEGG